MKVVVCYYDTHIFFWFIKKNHNPETEPLWFWLDFSLATMLKDRLEDDEDLKNDFIAKIWKKNKLMWLAVKKTKWPRDLHLVKI